MIAGLHRGLPTAAAARSPSSLLFFFFARARASVKASDSYRGGPVRFLARARVAAHRMCPFAVSESDAVENNSSRASAPLSSGFSPVNGQSMIIGRARSDSSSQERRRSYQDTTHDDASIGANSILFLRRSVPKFSARV